MNLTYFSEFLIKMSSNGPNNLLKLFLSRVTNFRLVLTLKTNNTLAITLAALGSPFIKANSPKKSPFLYSFTHVAGFPISHLLIYLVLLS